MTSKPVSRAPLRTPGRLDLSGDRAVPLDARQIDQRLGVLWKQAAAATPGVARTASQTLVVLLLDPALSPWVEAVLDQVPAAHPCRVIVVAAVDVEPRALLSAHSRPSREGLPPSSWESIRLEGRQSDVQRLMSAAGSLVLANLPVQIWWPGEPELTSQLFERIVELGNRIIVDSAHFRDPLTALARYAEHAEAEHGTVAFTDLNWGRLEQWRLQLAQFFDAPPDRTFLNHVESVTVGYAGAAGETASGFAEALLMVGWLASRLGWTLAAGRVGQDRPLDVLLFEDGGRTVQVELRRGKAVTADDGLLRVQLSSSMDEQTARYLVERRDDGGLTRSEIDGDRREAPVHLPTPARADLLGRELGSFGRDRIYEEAVQSVRQLASQVGVVAPA